MRKLIDLDQTTLRRLKIIAALENTNVKNLIEEKIVGNFLKSKENETLKKLTEEEKEDLGLYLLMKEEEEKENKFIAREEIIKILDRKGE